MLKRTLEFASNFLYNFKLSEYLDKIWGELTISHWSFPRLENVTWQKWVFILSDEKQHFKSPKMTIASGSIPCLNASQYVHASLQHIYAFQ